MTSADSDAVGAARSPFPLPQVSRPVRRPLSRRKKWLFRAAAVLSPVALLLILEVVLRILGVGQDLRLIEAAGKRAPAGMHRFNPEADRAYYGATNLAGPEPRPFLLPKPQGVFRIVVIGGSTVVGFPYPSELAFPRLLEITLQAQGTEREFEVLNAGITGLGTISEADVLEQALASAPDLLIVYTGQNEFVAPGSVASKFGEVSPEWAPLYYGLRRTRLHQLGMRFLNGRARRELKPLMEQLPGDLEVRHGGTKFQLAEEHFRKNLERMAAAAVRAQVPLLLTTPVVNLRDQPPMKSLFKEGITAKERRAWDDAFDEGCRLQSQGSAAAALEAFDRALAIDNGHALLVYRQAQALESLGRDEEAGAAYKLACDLDGCRFRAPSSFARILAEVASGRHGDLISFVDTAAELARSSPCGAPGSESLFEHVHFTYEGNWRLAEVFAERILRDVLKGAWRGGPEEADRDDLCGVTPQDHFVALAMVLVMLERPPLNQTAPEARVRSLRAEVDRVLAPLSGPEQAILGGLTLAQLERDLIGSLLSTYESAGLDDLVGPLLERGLVRQPWRSDWWESLADWESRHEHPDRAQECLVQAARWKRRPGRNTQAPR